MSARAHHTRVGREGIDSPIDVPLDLLRTLSHGRAYDLSSGWWPQMPGYTGHAPLQVLTYRTPRGTRNAADIALLEDDNQVGHGFISDLVSGTTHIGTHIDALAHITAGPRHEWHGGHSADTELGDFGPLSGDASELRPLIARGVLLDIPSAVNRDALDANTPVGRAELMAATDRQGTTVRSGDVVLVRTGMMRDWPDLDALARAEGAGVSLDGARWLLDQNPAAVGSDTESFEVFPSGVPGDPEPVHRFLIQQHGVPIIEWVYLEQLAQDAVHEFLFVCLPLPIRGATGSMIRPLAVV